MKPLILRPLLLILILSVHSLQGYAQEPSGTDTLETTIRPIPVTDIILRATEINTQLREKRTLLLSDQQKQEISSRLDSLRFRLSLMREDPRIHKTTELNLRSLENLESEWSFLDRLFDTEQETMNALLQEKEKQRSQLVRILSEWELTSETVDEELTAELVIEQINNTLRDIRETQSLFQSDSKFIQEELVEITSGVIFTNKVLEQIQKARMEVTRNLLSLDQPPIWRHFSHKKDTTIIFREQRSILEDSATEFRDFYNQYSGRLWLHLVLSLAFIILIIITFQNLKHSIPDSDNPDIIAVKKVTEKPLASGFMIALILTFILYRNIPDSVFLIISLLFLVPTVIILRSLITGAARRYILLPLAAVILVEIHRIGYSETLFSRLWLVLIILFAMMILVLNFGRKSQRLVALSIRSGRLLVIAALLAFIMLIIAFFASIAGAITLAEFLTYSVIESATISLFLLAVVSILRSILATVVYSKYFGRSSIFTQYRELIYRRMKGLIDLIGIVLLINFICRIFNVWDPVWSSIKTVFTYELTVGSMHFSLWDIVLFVLILWLTLSISRFVRTFFEAEAGLRDRMRRGAPGAVSLLLRITIITIGFMLAVAAAGVQMDKLAILLGAFGVGIGFGLQNIFNNLVSGIILAFERPIKEGDIIEVGNLLGTVREIGLRSSVVRTYDGSEVIVPNGNLISNELINWTRTDMMRRGEVLVGVAYGTNPQKVIDLLLDTARNFGRVLEHPEPIALFLGFGESSLDFRLLFWMADADHRLVIQSEMAVLVNHAIREAGIEIPFPQRDLHVRSVDSRILDRVRAQDEIAGKQKGKTDHPE